MKTPLLSQDFLDAFPDGIFETDLKLHLMYANKPAYEMFGYSKSEIKKGFNALQLFDTGDVVRLMANTAKLIAGQTILPRVYRMRRKDGRFFMAQINSIPVRRKNKIVGFRGIVRDLTIEGMLKDQLESESEKRLESEQRLSFLLSNAPLALFAGNMAGDVTFAQGQYVELLGLPAEISAGARVLSNDPAPMAFLHNIRKAIAGEENSSTMDVAGILFSVRYAPLRDSDGQIIGFIGVAIDISNQRECEELRVLKESYMQLTERIQQAMRNKKPVSSAALKGLLAETPKGSRKKT